MALVEAVEAMRIYTAAGYRQMLSLRGFEARKACLKATLWCNAVHCPSETEVPPYSTYLRKVQHLNLAGFGRSSLFLEVER